MRISFRALLILSVFVASFGFAQSDTLTKPKYGPAGNPLASPLSEDHEYFRSHSSSKFWVLNSYYVGQFNDQSCSAASLSMVLNAARHKIPKADGEKLFSPEGLVDSLNVEHWKERVSSEGFQKERGTSLDIFAKIAEAAFKKHGFPKVKIEVVHVNDLKPATLAKIQQDLIKNEADSDGFMITNFSMKSFLDTGDYGHIAPVGAYDAAKRRVLVFDVYRQEYEPYWLDEKVFIQGMNTKDTDGSSHRGYLFIHLNSG